jgi:hypothetical protein
VKARELRSATTIRRALTSNNVYALPETKSKKIPNNGADAQNKYVALQFSKYCCSGDLVESQSTLMTWAESASAIGELTTKRNKGKFQETSSVVQKAHRYRKMTITRRQLEASCKEYIWISDLLRICSPMLRRMAVIPRPRMIAIVTCTNSNSDKSIPYNEKSY